MTDAASPEPAEDLDAIVAALARLRGRGPGPGGPRGAGPGFRGHGGPHRHPGHEWLHGGEGDDPRRRPPWADGVRMGGPARLRVLEALAAASRPLSVSEVGEAIGVDQPRASRLVQQAAELGFVRREADPDDARRTRIALTDEGVRIVRGFRGQRRAHVEEALAGFSDAERADLARLLTKLAASWPQH